MIKKMLLYTLVATCSALAARTDVNQKLKSLLDYEWNNTGTQAKDITDRFLPLLPADKTKQVLNMKAFELLQEKNGKFIIIVTDSDINFVYAKLQFGYRFRQDIKSKTNYKIGYIELLHVVKKDIRKSGLGSALLRYVLTKDYADIEHIELYAYPFDYTAQIQQSEKLPQLLSFYQRHGGILINNFGNTAEIYFNL